MKIPKEAMTDIKQSIDSTSSTKVSSKRKRNSNFSKAEMQCLITEYSARIKAINFGTREQKQKSWEAITAIINKTHSDFTRSAIEIKKKWIDLLYSTKREYAKVIKEAEKTGNKKRRRLSDIAEMVVKVKGGFAVKQRNEIKVEEDVPIRTPTSFEDEKLNGQTETTFYIPHVNECPSSDDDSQEAADSMSFPETMGDANFNVSSGGISAGGNYRTFGQILNISAPATCNCGLYSEHLRLKQETVDLLKREVEIEEERRNEEKQKWWEEKVIRRLWMQKLELEIKVLKSNMATQL